MLTGEEKARIIREIVAELRECERFCEQDFRNKYALTGPDARLVWEAREIVRKEDGIVFGAIPKWPGTFRRLDWAQVARQAERQRAAGTRKHGRAGEKLRLASEKAPDEERQRLSDAADRVALRVAMHKQRRAG